MEPIFNALADNQPAKYQVSPSAPPLVNQPDAEPAKTPVKRLIKKKGSGFTPSIKDALSGKLTEESRAGDAPEKMKYFTGEEMNEPFTKEAFEATWTEYLNRLQDRPGLKSALSRVPEILEGCKLKLTIDNSVQLEEIAKIKPDLVSWLRRELKNTTIELISEIAVREIEAKAYTETEKLAEMVKKNPNLGLLRQRFNMDFGEM